MSLNAVGAPRRTRAVSENKIACSTNAALRRGSPAFGKGSEGCGEACLGRDFESESRELKVACSAVDVSRCRFGARSQFYEHRA